MPIGPMIDELRDSTIRADVKIVVPTVHRGTAEGKPARIFFSNVAIKLAGTDKWMDAQKEMRG